jgi:lysophospholipase L1-like esterase
MLTFLLRFLPSGRRRGRAGTRRPRPPFRPALEQLGERTLLSATATIAAMGDSLTASYQGTPQGAAGDRNWVQQLQAEGSKHLAIDDVAVPGAASGDLGGQAATVANLVRAGSVQYATLIVGGNDVTANLRTILAGNPTPFVTEVVAHIESALETVAAAGPVHLVVGNIPDVSITPALESLIPNPLLRQEVTQAIAIANQQIEAFAAARAIPVIDLFRSGRLAEQPLTLAGVQVNNFYAADGFHPGSILQGLLADTILEALGDAYDPSLERFTLTEQQLLDNAPTPILHQPGHTFFDVSPFVLVSGPHDGDQDPAVGRVAAPFGSFAGVGNPDVGGGAVPSSAVADEGLEALHRLFAAANTEFLGETGLGGLSR